METIVKLKLEQLRRWYTKSSSGMHLVGVAGFGAPEPAAAADAGAGAAAAAAAAAGAGAGAGAGGGAGAEAGAGAQGANAATAALLHPDNTLEMCKPQQLLQRVLEASSSKLTGLFNAPFDSRWRDAAGMLLTGVC